MSAPARRTDPRARALSVLVDVMEADVFGAARLAELQEDHPLSVADAGLAMELVLGTTRHRITCEHIAAHFFRGRWAGLHSVLRLNMAMAVYQLCWLDRVPDHAVVDSAVRLASSHGRGATSRINAILRSVAASRGAVVEAQGDTSPRRWLPIEESRGRLFDCDIFPDPARRPREYLTAITSHPPFLVERWHRRFKPKLCRQILDAGNRRPRLVLRPNTMRTTAEELLARLKSNSHSAHLIDSHVAVEDVSSPADLDVFREGLCQPQDTTAGIALTLAPPVAGEFVLDLCAGSGTKSTQAAELMGNRGRVLATDADDARLMRIAENTARLGLTIVETVPLGGLDAAIAGAGKPPDLILIDAPCSNTGVLSRRPEARYRATHKSIASLVEIQRGLLASVVSLSGPNTRLIYSTCSIEAEENEQQVAAFLESHPGWAMATSRFTLPDADRDGGYAAVLRQEVNAE